MKANARDRMMLAEVALIERVRTAARGVQARLARVVTDEAGQTPTEYLMIVGLMAAVIVTIFVTFFWQGIRSAASSWIYKVQSAVMGSGIQ